MRTRTGCCRGLVGIANAAEILLTGATFDGHRAVQLGLGSKVLDAADVLPATSSAAGSTSAASSTLLPTPSCTARCPSKVAPVNRISAALAIPTSRGSTQCEYASPTTPRRTCTTP